LSPSTPIGSAPRPNPPVTRDADGLEHRLELQAVPAWPAVTISDSGRCPCSQARWETVSVTGFDDVFGTDFCHPPLTTVAAPTEEAGRALVDVLLDDRLAEPEQTVLSVRLRIHGSAGPLTRGLATE
jgi:Periplasmic binding protein-like domain